MDIVIRLLIAVPLLLLAVASGFWKLYHTGFTAGVLETQATYQAQALEAERQARATERAKTTALNAVQVKHEQTKQTAAAAAAAADSELERLRALLATPITPQPPSTDPTAPARADDATRARLVVGQCAGALTSMAATADALEARLTGLQDYVTRVCLVPAKP